MALLLLWLWHRNGHHLQPINAAEVIGVAGVEREIVGERIAAIITSKVRAFALRPARRNEADTPPKARAAAASKGRGSKAASACCR